MKGKQISALKKVKFINCLAKCLLIDSDEITIEATEPDTSMTF